jgi:hypothetical protein
MNRYTVIRELMQMEGLDFTLDGTQRIRGLAWVLLNADAYGLPAQPGAVMEDYAKKNRLKKDSVYKSCFYALRQAGLPYSVMGAIRRFAALAIMEGARYWG